MFVRQIPNKSTGRTAVCIVKSYRDLNSGKTRSTIIENLGFLDVLSQAHEEPIVWAKERAERLTANEKLTRVEKRDGFDLNEHIEVVEDGKINKLRKNIGYAPFSFLYHDLEIDEFIDNRRRYTKRQHNPNTILKMLVYNRLLFPNSKKAAFENRNIFFEDINYSLDNVYSSLDYILEYRKPLLEKIHNQIKKLYHRDTLLLFYDVTNYYFEIDDNDPDIITTEGNFIEGIRKKGCSKEHRTSPIVQMGLFMDEKGIPVSYDLFAGNTHDSKTLIPMLEESFNDFNISNMIVVADKGMMGGDNLRDIILKHKGYVISSSVRKADKQFINYVTDEDGYIELYDSETGILEFKYKSRTTPRYIKVTTPSGGKQNIKINEHQIIMWSRKYAERERKNRDKTIEKSNKLTNSNSKNAMILPFGSRKYICKKPVDKKGRIIEVADYTICLDTDRIEAEEILDGYYAICTNVRGISENSKPFKEGQRCRFSKKDNFFEVNKELSDLDIVDMYHGLWRIEETFKVTKSDLKSRPVYAWTNSRIRAHFLVCFISLILMRLLQYRLDWKYSASKIQESLSLASGTLINSNMFAFNHFDEVLKDIGNIFDIDLGLRYRTAGEIKSLLAKTKKYKD